MVLPSESFHGTVLGMGTCAIAVTVVASRTAMTNFMAHHSCFQFCIEIDERLLDILSIPMPSVSATVPRLVCRMLS